MQLFLLAAGARLAYLFLVRPAFETGYWALANGLIAHGSFIVDGATITDFEPIYPLFLAVTRLLLRDQVLLVQAAQACLASLGAVYLYRLANALTGEKQLAAIAALLFAVHPLLIRQAAQASDLALVTTLLTAFAYYFVIGADTIGTVRAGVVLGLVVLTRTMALPLVPLAAGVLVAQRRFRATVALTTTVLLFVIPFVAWTHSTSGSLWPTRSGVNLYVGNSPYTAALLPDHDPDILQKHAAAVIESEAPHLAGGSPEYKGAADALLTRYALDYMFERPLGTLWQKTLNVLHFFSPRLVPFHTAGPETRAVNRGGRVIVENPRRRPPIEVWSYSLFYTPVLIAAILGIFWRGRDLTRDAILWCIAATFVAVHALYFPATRYRAPMAFVLLFYAAVAARRWLRSVTSRATGSPD